MIRRWQTPWRRAARIAGEMAIAFGALIALDRWLLGGGGFATTHPSPFWLPVLVMALAYGTGPGVIAAAISSALWLANVPALGSESDYLDHLFHLSLPPLMWFVAAIIVGETTIIRTARYRRLERRAHIGTRNVGRMTEAFDTLSATNRILQVQIATEARTVGRVIDTATRLSAPDPVERRAAITRLIALAARTDDFSCYRIAGDEALAWLRGATTAGRREMLPVALLERVIRRRGILHVARRSDRAVLEGVGVAAIALTDPRTGHLAGCLVLHALPFSALDAGRVAELSEIAAWLTPLLADTVRPAHLTVRPTGLVA